MDWYIEGKKTALEGYTRKQGRAHYVDKCQENKGVVFDAVDFERGFKRGLVQLCTPEGRKNMDSQGIKYQNTCDSHEESQDFEKNRSAELESENSRLKRENARLLTEIETLKSQAGACPPTD